MVNLYFAGEKPIVLWLIYIFPDPDQLALCNISSSKRIEIGSDVFWWIRCWFSRYESGNFHSRCEYRKENSDTFSLLWHGIGIEKGFYFRHEPFDIGSIFTKLVSNNFHKIRIHVELTRVYCKFSNVNWEYTPKRSIKLRYTGNSYHNY